MPKRMWDEKEIIKIAEEHGGEGGGAVQSVNGKTGKVVLSASDIKSTNTQSIQANLERIDLEVEGLVDDVADLNTSKLDASKSALSAIGGLVVPMSTPTSDELVGIDTTGAQARVTIGSGLTLVNGELSATGGGTGGVSKEYVDGEISRVEGEIPDVSGKLDRVDTADTYRRAYSVDSNGNQALTPMSAGNIADSICRRNTTGNIAVGEPTVDSHAATKAYVDGLLADKQDKLDTWANYAYEDEDWEGKRQAHIQFLVATEKGTYDINDVTFKLGDTVTGSVGSDNKWNGLTINGEYHDLATGGGQPQPAEVQIDNKTIVKEDGKLKTVIGGGESVDVIQEFDVKATISDDSFTDTEQLVTSEQTFWRDLQFKANLDGWDTTFLPTKIEFDMDAFRYFAYYYPNGSDVFPDGACIRIQCTGTEETAIINPYETIKIRGSSFTGTHLYVSLYKVEQVGATYIPVDGQTIIVEDGKLKAVSSTPSNMVTTDTKQDITGAKLFKQSVVGIVRSDGTDSQYVPAAMLQYVSNQPKITIGTMLVSALRTQSGISGANSKLVVEFTPNSQTQVVNAYPTVSKFSLGTTNNKFLNIYATNVNGCAEETWTFTLADGSTVTKTLMAK